jgi:hypothetical protein
MNDPHWQANGRQIRTCLNTRTNSNISAKKLKIALLFIDARQLQINPASDA